MKKILAIILTVLMILAFALTATACEPMIDDYQSDTFELGESTLTK